MHHFHKQERSCTLISQVSKFLVHAILIVVSVGFDGQNWIPQNSPDFKEGSSFLITENVLRLHHLDKIDYFDF